MLTQSRVQIDAQPVLGWLDGQPPTPPTHALAVEMALGL